MFCYKVKQELEKKYSMFELQFSADSLTILNELLMNQDKIATQQIFSNSQGKTRCSSENMGANSLILTTNHSSKQEMEQQGSDDHQSCCASIPCDLPPPPLHILFSEESSLKPLPNHPLAQPLRPCYICLYIHRYICHHLCPHICHHICH
jgi:hypothetical protein